MNNYQITEWCRHFQSLQVKPGDPLYRCRQGNGHDTLYLSRLVGSQGKVLSFDIQPAALAATRQRLQEENAPYKCSLILDSHSHMARIYRSRHDLPVSFLISDMSPLAIIP